MKIVCDDKIPFLRGVLEPFAEVVYLPGKQTTADVVRDADAVITRTRTRCDAALLSGSRVKVIATATIGFDHIDTAWCEANGVDFTYYKPAGDSTAERVAMVEKADDEGYIEAELPEILEALFDDACRRGLIDDNATARDLFDTKLMGVLTPFPHPISR